MINFINVSSGVNGGVIFLMISYVVFIAVVVGQILLDKGLTLPRQILYSMLVILIPLLGLLLYYYIRKSKRLSAR